MTGFAYFLLQNKTRSKFFRSTAESATCTTGTPSIIPGSVVLAGKAGVGMSSRCWKTSEVRASVPLYTRNATSPATMMRFPSSNHTSESAVQGFGTDESSTRCLLSFLVEGFISWVDSETEVVASRWLWMMFERTPSAKVTPALWLGSICGNLDEAVATQCQTSVS